jgi:ADP-ribosyl-[dinitrogen reductase] hydrolase
MKKMLSDGLLQRITGCLLGAAIGDALGMPNEDLTQEERDRYYGGEVRDFTDPNENSPCANLRAGQHTDDTQLVIATAESLVESRRFDPRSLKNKLIEWLDMKDDGRYRGEATKQGIMNLKRGVPWRKAGVNKAGCGSSTRSIPFGLFYYTDIAQAVKSARLASCMTHNNDIAYDGCACVASTIANLTAGQLPEINSLKTLVQTVEFKSKLDEVGRCLRNSYTASRAKETIGISNIAHETVCIALFLFLSDATDFAASVLAGANAVLKGKKGDTDSIACLVGAMSGAYNGVGSIPKEWLDRVESGRKLTKVARRLFESHASYHSP